MIDIVEVRARKANSETEDTDPEEGFCVISTVIRNNNPVLNLYDYLCCVYVSIAI